MKKLLLVLAMFVSSSCSLDNKTGIWKDASDILVENQTSKSISQNQTGTKYEEIFTKNQSFDKEIDSADSTDIKIDTPIKIMNWSERYGIGTNNISNIYYSDKKILLSKSSKLSKPHSNSNNFASNIVFYKNNLISYNHKGEIFIYSLSLSKKIFKYNFYRKNFKNFNKELNFIVDDNILYVTDNLGYLYALNLDNKSIKWAKNYGIPFRSNIKFSDNQIFVSNQDNVIYSIDSNTGEKNWQFATSLTFLKSNFENNFALDLLNNNLFFLNTSGELHSINYLTQKINWVLNFKNPSLAGDTELFLSHPLIVKNNNLIVTTEKAILSYNTSTASRNWIFSSEPIFKPIITTNNTFALLKNDLLICIDNISGNIVWSRNIFRGIKNKKIIKKFSSVADFKIVNNKINVYSANGHLLLFDPSNGNLNSVSTISKRGINSEIFFLDGNMLFIDNKKKLLKFN